MDVEVGEVGLEGLDQGSDVVCERRVSGLSDCYTVLVLFDKHLKACLVEFIDSF